MANRLTNWGGARRTTSRSPVPASVSQKQAEPEQKENTGFSRFLFGAGKTKDSARNAEAQKTANARANPRPRLTTETLNRSLASGGRGGTGMQNIPAMQEQAKVGDAEVRREQAAERRRAQEAANSRKATTRELTYDEWDALTPSQQRQVELNGTLLSAIETNKTSGNTASTDDLRKQLGIEDSVVSSEEFAAGVTAIRESDLFGKGNMRPGAGVLVDGSGQEDSILHQTGLKKAQPWTSRTSGTDRQRMIESISAGVEKYFAQLGSTPEMESSSLDSILGKTSVTTGASQTDQYLAEIYDSAARKSTWEGGATYDQLMSALSDVQIDPALFAQYAGEKAAAAEKSGLPLIDDGGDSLDVAAFRAALGLKEN